MAFCHTLEYVILLICYSLENTTPVNQNKRVKIKERRAG